MNIHEYQAKELLRRYGVAVPTGGCRTADEAVGGGRTRCLGGPVAVVKAQIHAGGRGKGRFKDDPAARAASSSSSRRRGASGGGGDARQDAGHDADRPGGQDGAAASTSRRLRHRRELYLGMLLDRDDRGESPSWPRPRAAWRSRRSPSKHPEKILRVAIDPAVGLAGFQARKLAFGLGLDGRQVGARSSSSCTALYKLFVETTARWSRSTRWSSPSDGEVLALDAKMSFDDNALFRHTDLRRAARRRRGGPAELEAGEARPHLRQARRQHRLPGERRRPRDGDDGHHQAPRRRAGELPRRRRRRRRRSRSPTAFSIILADPNVKAVLVNIFGGIMRCTSIAEGVVAAATRGRPQGAAGRAPRRHQRRAGQARSWPRAASPIIAADRPDRRAPRRSSRPSAKEAQAMSILVNKNTRVIVPGHHRRAGHLPRQAGCLEYGTQDGRRRHARQGRHDALEGLPVFDTVREAVEDDRRQRHA